MTDEQKTVTTFEIDGVEYNVIKRGIGQARQVADLGRWLADHGTQAYRAVLSEGDGASGVQMVAAVLGTLSGEALIEVYVLVFGCPVAVAEECFEIDTLVEGILALYENSKAIKRLVGRFFSGSNSATIVEGNSTK